MDSPVGRVRPAGQQLIITYHRVRYWTGFPDNIVAAVSVCLTDTGGGLCPCVEEVRPGGSDVRLRHQ